MFSSILEHGTKKWITSAIAESSVPNHDFHSCHLGLDFRGNALAVWNENVKGGFKSAKFFKKHGGWITPTEAVVAQNNVKMEETILRVNEYGNGILLWISKNENAEGVTRTLMASTYISKESQWSAPFVLADTLEEDYQAEVALSSEGGCYILLNSKKSIQVLGGDNLFPSDWKRGFIPGIRNTQP
jgi:hypothetical protein